MHCEELSGPASTTLIQYAIDEVGRSLQEKMQVFFMHIFPFTHRCEHKNMQITEKLEQWGL